MRTTITLDPDVEAMVKKLMSEGGMTFKQAVNEAIRKGLAPKRRSPVTFPTYDMGVIRIPGHKVLQFAADLEDQEIIRKMRAREPRSKGPGGPSAGG